MFELSKFSLRRVVNGIKSLRRVTSKVVRLLSLLRRLTSDGILNT